jgi:hypothetical protein
LNIVIRCHGSKSSAQACERGFSRCLLAREWASRAQLTVCRQAFATRGNDRHAVFVNGGFDTANERRRASASLDLRAESL